MCIKKTHKHSPCPTCKGKVVGRSDKRFCSLKCKNEHHRIARIQIKSRFYEIQKKLHRNIIVMEGILGTEDQNMSIHKEVLFKHGFNAELFTGKIFKDNVEWRELGDYHFVDGEEGIMHIERSKKLSSSMPVFFARWAIDFPKGLVVGNGIIMDEARDVRQNE